MSGDLGAGGVWRQGGDSVVSRWNSRWASGTVSAIVPQSSGGARSGSSGRTGAGCAERSMAAITARNARAAMAKVTCRFHAQYILT